MLISICSQNVQQWSIRSWKLQTLLCYFAWPSVTSAEAQVPDNRPASGLVSTMEIIRESSGINWVWLRTLFKGTWFPPLDIIGDHLEGSGGEGSGVEEAWWLAPVACLLSHYSLGEKECVTQMAIPPWKSCITIQGHGICSLSATNGSVHPF